MKLTKKDIDIELFLLCFNEEKMIPHTLNYYSSFCNKITIINNDSTDRSIEVAENFSKDIHIMRLNSNGEYREDLMIEMRNNCWKGSAADYVIVCDMDEFLYDEYLQEKLIESKEKKIAIPVITGFNMMASNFPGDYNTPITSQVKLGIRDRMFDKHIIFDPKLVKNMNFGPGSHSCNPEFYTEEMRDGLLELKLLHYKYLDRNYLYNKHENYSERMSQINKENKWGFEYNLGQNYIDKVFNLSHYLIKIIK